MICSPFNFGSSLSTGRLQNNEKLNEDELKELSELQKKIKRLMEGESIGTPRKPSDYGKNNSDMLDD